MNDTNDVVTTNDIRNATKAIEEFYVQRVVLPPDIEKSERGARGLDGGAGGGIAKSTPALAVTVTLPRYCVRTDCAGVYVRPAIHAEEAASLRRTVAGRTMQAIASAASAAMKLIGRTNDQS